MSPIQLASIPNDDPSHIGYGFGIWVPSKLPRCQDNLHLPDLESPLPLFFYPHALGNAPLPPSWMSGRETYTLSNQEYQQHPSYQQVHAYSNDPLVSTAAPK